LEYHQMTQVTYQARLPFELHADGTVDGYDLPATVGSAIRQVLEDTPTRAAQGLPDNGESALHNHRR
jgi:hypothetical protein